MLVFGCGRYQLSTFRPCIPLKGNASLGMASAAGFFFNVRRKSHVTVAFNIRKTHETPK
jgi:hypothetical protein